MRRVCPACGEALPNADLPVCAHCGAPVSADDEPPADLVLPVSGFETAEELLERFFEPPVTYTLSAWTYAVQLLAPVALPIVAVAMGANRADSGVRWLVPVFVILSVGLMLHIGINRRPARSAVVLSTRGLRQGRRRRLWDDVAGSRIVDTARARDEQPEALEILFGDGESFRITKEQARGAGIGSLRNLAGIVELVVVALARERDQLGSES